MNWQSVKLSEICPSDAPITYGILQPGPIVPGGVPYVRPSEIRDGQIDLNSIRRTTPEIAAKYKKSAIAEGDVLITIVGTIGSIAMVPPELHGANITQSSARVRVCEKRATRDYIKHYLRSPLAIRQYDQHRLGVAVPRLNLHHVRDLEIPLPPLAEQKRIAGILDAADVLRAKRREALAQLDTLLQATFLDLFGDPVTNPKGWEQSKLGSLCEVGSSKRVFVEELVEEGVPFYRGTEVGSLGAGEPVTPTLFITAKHYEALKEETGVPRVGDLLLPSICPDGRIYIVRDEQPFYFKDGRVLWIKAGESGINSVFLRYHLKHVFAADYAKIASGTTFAELKIFALKGLVVHVPPPERQKHFARFVDRCERQIADCRAHLAELDNLFASLQSRAFKGEL